MSPSLAMAMDQRRSIEKTGKKKVQNHWQKNKQSQLRLLRLPHSHCIPHPIHPCIAIRPFVLSPIRSGTLLVLHQLMLTARCAICFVLRFIVFVFLLAWDSIPLLLILCLILGCQFLCSTSITSRLPHFCSSSSDLSLRPSLSPIFFLSPIGC